MDYTLIQIRMASRETVEDALGMLAPGWDGVRVVDSRDMWTTLAVGAADARTLGPALATLVKAAVVVSSVGSGTPGTSGFAVMAYDKSGTALGPLDGRSADPTTLGRLATLAGLPPSRGEQLGFALTTPGDPDAKHAAVAAALGLPVPEGLPDSAAVPASTPPRLSSTDPERVRATFAGRRRMRNVRRGLVVLEVVALVVAILSWTENRLVGVGAGIGALVVLEVVRQVLGRVGPRSQT